MRIHHDAVTIADVATGDTRPSALAEPDPETLMAYLMVFVPDLYDKAEIAERGPEPRPQQEPETQR
ncbi:hypothetical protein GCM10010411_76470 [Actinomadura fulvescens]|uniref:Uncharacterized protein n=1 Tax=Actinomadura fulvescens TaxID=46160 RepID=A0ABN3QJN4_9ACTN